MKAVTNVIQKLRCLRCGHTWFPHSTKKPKTCANQKCRSPYWDRPVSRKSVSLGRRKSKIGQTV